MAFFLLSFEVFPFWISDKLAPGFIITIKVIVMETKINFAIIWYTIHYCLHKFCIAWCSLTIIYWYIFYANIKSKKVYTKYSRVCLKRVTMTYI